MALVSAYLAISDDDLIARARRHDEQAFEVLMRRYNRRLFRIARSILRSDEMAEDAVQETYIQVFTKLDRYQAMGRFGSWISKVAVNEALMLKRGARADTLSLDALDERTWSHSESLTQDAPDADPLDSVHTRKLIELAVDALPEAFRTVFVLRVVENMSISETAECLSLNESTVKTRLHRACRALHAQLSRRLRRERLNIFEFDGVRCDRIVCAVLTRYFSSATHPP
jgi:RNA polymerase sigma-70 factor (ECF subfamily)